MASLDPNPDCQDSEHGWNFKRNASKYNAGFSTRSWRINKEAQLLLSLQNHIFQTQTTIVMNLVPCDFIADSHLQTFEISDSHEASAIAQH